MSSETEKDLIEKAIQTCTTVQSMIDFAAKHLYGLRTQCAPNEEITQKEIRDTESKMIKLFSQQLVAKAKFNTEDIPEKLAEFPKTDRWLKVVGIQEEAVLGVVEKGVTLLSLLKMSEEEVRNLLLHYECGEEDIRKLNAALKNLKTWTEKQMSGEDTNDSDVELHWTNYKSLNSSYGGNSPKYIQRPSTSSLPPENYSNMQSPQLPTPPQSTPSSPVNRQSTERYRYTPPPTPPLVRPKSASNKYPSTPPLKMKKIIQLFPDVFPPLTKSRSHESQLASRVTNIDLVKPKKKRPSDQKLGGSFEVLNERRFSAEGTETGGGNSQGLSGHNSPSLSPIRSPPYKQDSILKDYFKSNTLSVPKSPIPLIPTSNISSNHRFITKPVLGTCDYCRKHLIGLGKICKECRYKCHRDCASKTLRGICTPVKEGSPNAGRHVDSALKSVNSVPVLQDSGSNTSSCNSSTPSSPALPITSPFSITSPSPAPSPKIHVTQFQFPEVVDGIIDTFPAPVFENNVENTDVNTITSNDSEKTLIDVTITDNPPLVRVNSVDSQDDPMGHNWYRQNSLSVQLKEWDIPFEELALGEEIGKGRFGTVYKGQWHGDVAIKMLNMDPDSDNQAQLSAFKLEVAMLKKTRHENLVLFMGACMKPPHLAIITSYCKGKSLFSCIYEYRQKFQLSKTVIIASQIAQGMGYLHARDIVHKDLKTKNIFWEESGKVVITDFGLFSVTKLCQGNRKGDCLAIPPGWLCYLSPEIMRSLQAGNSKQANTDLPFTQKSDVYAFGTVWYELLCGEWPFKHQPPECIVWQVGRGIKQSLCHIMAPRDVKDILMDCWTYKWEDRPEFSQVLKALSRLPKKPLLVRSPSHPVHLSRSVDSVYVA